MATMKTLVLIFVICFYAIIMFKMVNYETKTKPVIIKEYTDKRVQQYKSELKEWKKNNSARYMLYLKKEFADRGFNKELALGIDYLLPD